MSLKSSKNQDWQDFQHATYACVNIQIRQIINPHLPLFMALIKTWSQVFFPATRDKADFLGAYPDGDL